MIISCIASTNLEKFDKLNKVIRIYDCYMNLEHDFSYIFHLEKTRYGIKIYMEIILNCKEDKNIWFFNI